MYSNNEWYDAMASLDDVFILDCIYIEGFDEVTIPNMVPEAILNEIAMSESASESDSTCKSNWITVIMRKAGNHIFHAIRK